jgi:peptidyl-tRNA hydrolase, PTH1 family
VAGSNEPATVVRLRDENAAREKTAKVDGSSVKLIVGLGNPGIEYQFTPHNLGFLTIDRLAEQLGTQVDNRHCRAVTGRGRIGDQEVVLAKPETFMNLSGLSVRELVTEYEIQPESDLIVIYDELDLPFGSLRVRQRGSAAGHNGMKSVIGALDTQEITRIRLGIGPDTPIRDGKSYVLRQLKKSELKLVDELLDNAAEAARVIVTEGVNVAMNRFNRRPETEEQT